jgi:hypothetical protein
MKVAIRQEQLKEGLSVGGQGHGMVGRVFPEEGFPAQAPVETVEGFSEKPPQGPMEENQAQQESQ